MNEKPLGDRSETEVDSWVSLISSPLYVSSHHSSLYIFSCVNLHPAWRAPVGRIGGEVRSRDTVSELVTRLIGALFAIILASYLIIVSSVLVRTGRGRCASEESSEWRKTHGTSSHHSYHMLLTRYLHSSFTQSATLSSLRVRVKHERRARTRRDVEATRLKAYHMSILSSIN